MENKNFKTDSYLPYIVDLASKLDQDGQNRVIGILMCLNALRKEQGGK